MWKCVKCGQELGNEWYFCWRCATQNDELLDLFLESYEKTLPENERNYILQNYDSFVVEAYGKSALDVRHNIELELKRKYKHLYWINKNSAALFLSMIAFGILVAHFIANETRLLETTLIFLTSYVLICSTSAYSFYIIILKKVGRKISAYEYYLRRKSKREWEKRREDKD